MNLPRIETKDLPASELANFNGQELAEFLSRKRILIVDTSGYSSQALHRILIQLGANTNEILIYRNFESAVQGILARRPHILITELFVDESPGLDLVSLHDRQFSNRLEIANLVLVPDASSASAGMIADATVDAVLVKPLNLQSAKEALFQAFANKVKPSPYWSTLERGKEHFNRTELEDALRLFEEAKSFDPKATLSYYYLGLVRQQQQQHEEALRSFRNGLAINPRDYRCLSAAFDAHLGRSEHGEAYSVLETIHENYPVNARRLLDFVKLAISVGKYEDIPNYYRVFANSETPDEKTARGLIAAMLVSAKAFAGREQKHQALKTLQSAAKLALRHRTLREESLRYFIETNHFEQAQIYFSELPATLKETPHLQLLSLEAYHGAGDSLEAVRFGSQMLKNGKAPARAYEIVIEHSRKIGRPAPVIARLRAEALDAHPRHSW